MIFINNGWIGVNTLIPNLLVYEAIKNNSINSPTLNSSNPITRKSISVQLTSLENCIAVKGISKSNGIAKRIRESLLFSAVMSVDVALK